MTAPPIATNNAVAVNNAVESVENRCGPSPTVGMKVKFTGLTQNLQVDPEVLTENPYSYKIES